jgi:hypothetical protein
MEENRALGYVKSLERTVEMDCRSVKEALEDLQEMCRIVSPEKNVPTGIIVDIREIYKLIQTRFTEIKAIQQLLKGKYHQYSRRDPLRDKEILEMGFIAKTTFTRFEENVKLIIEKEKAKEREKAARASQRDKILLWFNSREKQILFLRKIRTLKELDYKPMPGKPVDDRRGMAGVRSLTLFLIEGEAPLIDSFQSQIRLREHDQIERYHERELRGVLAHLREVDPSEIERLFQLFFEKTKILNLKCVLIPIHPHKDINPEKIDSVAEILKEMNGGEVRTVSM